MNVWVNGWLRGLCKALCGAIMVLEKRYPSTDIYLFPFTSLTSGQRGTLVWVHRASLPGLRIPGCRGTGDRGGHRHRQRAVFCLGTHDHRAELPGRLPVRQVEHQGRARLYSSLRQLRRFYWATLSWSFFLVFLLFFSPIAVDPSVRTRLPVPTVSHRDGRRTDESAAAAHWGWSHCSDGEARHR